MYWKSNPSTAPPTWMALLMTPIGLCSRQHPFYLFLSTCIFLYILEISVTGWMHLGKGNLAPSYRSSWKVITDFMTGWEEETLLKHLQSQEHCSAAGTIGHGHPDRRRNVPGNSQDFYEFTVPQRGQSAVSWQQPNWQQALPLSSLHIWNAPSCKIFQHSFPIKSQ